MTTPINSIELIDVQKIFRENEREVRALDGISLSIEQGEIFGIIGLSGAGKSTLVRCINYLERPTSGTVLVEGKDLSSLSEKELLEQRRRIGMISQSFNLLEQRTALDNVCFPLELSGVEKAKAAERARELLSLVGLADREQAYPAQLSGGMQQRVAIARALAMNPSILLCDEATSALDPATTIQILDLLKEIQQKLNVTIVVITHEMRVIERICDRVAILDQSRVAESGTVNEVFRHPKTAAARRLIYPQGESKENVTTARLVRLAFDGTTTDQPIVANMVLACGEPVNILAADTKRIEGKTVGHMILELPDSPEAVAKILAYLDASRISYTEVDNV